MTKQQEQMDIPAGVQAPVDEEEKPIAIVQKKKKRGYL
jgi:hypothetical protein